MRKQSKATRIRSYLLKHPQANAKQISFATNIDLPYVHTVLWADKKKKTVQVTTPNSVRGSITMAADEVTKLTPEQTERLAHNLGQPRTRMQATPEMKTIAITTSNTSVADNVNHPPHYKVGGIETIDFIEAKKFGYNLGNVVKYLARAEHKGNREEDLLKARWYLNREISKLVGAEK